MRLNRTVLALPLTVALFGLAACGGDDGDGGGDGGSAGASGTSSASDSSDSSGSSGDSPSPSDLMLTDSASPAGYSWNDASEVLGDDEQFDQLNEIAEATVTDPEQCAPLAPSAVSVLVDLRDNPDTTGAVEFLPHDETDPAVVDAVVSTDPESLALPEDMAQCETFTQNNEAAEDEPEVTYQASTSDTEIVGAENTKVVTITSDSQGPGGDETTSVITGTVNGVAFRVTASGIEEPRILTDIVDRQVDRIAEVTSGGDD